MEELADQLTGVLHEIVAVESDTAQPRMSKHFSPQRGIYGAGGDKPVDAAEVIAALPVPVVDANDPGAAVLATTSGTPPAQLEHALDLARTGAQQANRSSVEVPLRLVRASLEIGAPADARKRLAELESVIPGDWRLAGTADNARCWRAHLKRPPPISRWCWPRCPASSPPRWRSLPPPNCVSARDVAARYYETVWRTDHSYVSAAFGLARQRVHAGDRAGAIRALDEVPPTQRISRPRPRLRSRFCSTAEHPRASTSRRCSMPASAPQH